MDWFGKSSKVEGEKEMESLGIIFEPIQFKPDLNEYELRIQLPGCPRNHIKLTYEKSSGQLKLQGKKQKTDFVHHFPVPTDCLPTGIYGRFRADVLHIIMPRLLSEWPASEDASSKQEADQKASSDREPTEQVGEDRENLPARVPEPSASDQKSTEKLTEGGGKDLDKLPAKVPEASSSDQKSTDRLTEREGKDRDKLPANVPKPSPSDKKSIEKLTEGGGKDRDKLPARDLSLPLPSPPFDQETTETLRQRDNELFPEISAPQPSVREGSSSVKELREKYQKNISTIAVPPPPPPPTPRATARTPSNQKAIKFGSRKEKEVDREPSSDRNKAKQGDIEPKKSAVKSQKTASELEQEVAENTKIAMAKEVDNESEKSIAEAESQKKVESKLGQEVAKNNKIVTESNVEKESEEKKPNAGGSEKLGLMAKVKETGKAALAAAMKEENRPVLIGAAVLAVVVIAASLRSSSKKTKN